jgi:hypothetical protein
MNNMPDNNNNMQLIEQTIDQIEALKESLFDLMKYHGSIHTIKEWDLFSTNYRLFELQEKLIRHQSKQNNRKNVYMIVDNSANY